MGEYIYRNHVAPRTKLFCSEGRFSDTSELHWCPETTKTCSDVLHEETIDDKWNIDGATSLSEPGIGVTRVGLLNKAPPEGHMWGQGRPTKKQYSGRRS